jgi:FixJ family two-component response regulator
VASSERAPAFVIVIEDDERSRCALGRLLLAGGFEPALFESAETFLSARPQREPLCMIVDVQLTGLSGLDLQERLRDEGSTVPIVVTTGSRTEAVRERALEAGCAALLWKPVCPDALLTLLRSMAAPLPS